MVCITIIIIIIIITYRMHREEEKCTQSYCIKSEEKGPARLPTRTLEDNIRMDVREI
jgi:hypothetical protein